MLNNKQIKKSDRRSYWENHIEKYCRSNLTQSAYCKQNNISYWSFNNWKRRIEKESGKTGLTEISKKIDRDLIPVNSSLEIVINNSLKIKIPDNFNPETLKKLMQVLGINI